MIVKCHVCSADPGGVEVAAGSIFIDPHQEDGSGGGDPVYARREHL